MKKLRVGIIGCGRISVMHLDPASQLEYSQLVACCDIVYEKALKVAKDYNINAYIDYKEMIDKENLDVVHICLPHHIHTEVSEYAFNKGVNVLSEKPMSIDYESAENAVKVAKEKGVLYGVIFQCRYNNSAQFVKKTLKDGKLGKIISARSVLTWIRDDAYYADCDWKGTWDKEGGGVIINQTIHTVDLVNWMIDCPFKKVFTTMSNRQHPTIKVEDTAEGLVLYENGVRYSFFATNNYGIDEPIEIKLHCEKGDVTFNYNDAYIVYKNGEKEEAHQHTTATYKWSMDYWGIQHVTQIEQFYKACLGLEPLDLSGEEALKTHKLICEIYKQGKLNFHNENE